MTETIFDLTNLPGYRWLENGQSAFSGELLDFYHRLDSSFLAWAQEWRASDHLFPPFLPAKELAKLDYFRSFPHLVTFPAVLDNDPDNVQRFADGEPCTVDGRVKLSRLAPVRDILTPAACYHFYIAMQNQELAGPAYLTTRATCFRREGHYAPLKRQWSFGMREIVCLGTRDEVEEFLKRWQERLTRYFMHAGLAVEWKSATDPFFNPSRNPRYLLQRLEAVKTEMVFAGQLAIGSINFHRNYFGETFHVRRDGEAVFSGCVAFGLERWIYAFLATCGEQPAAWPLPDGAPT